MFNLFSYFCHENTLGYLHWTNLGLTKLMEVSISQIDFTKIDCLQISSFLRQTKNTKKTIKKVKLPQNVFFLPQGDPHRALTGPHRALIGPYRALIWPFKALIGATV